MSYAGLGQTSTAMMPVATVGRDPSRHEAGGAVRVGARWAQRAVNAGNRYNNSFAPLIVVDGHAGPITISNLRALSHQFAADQPVTNDPPTSRVTDTVIIPVALESALATKAFVPDPPASTATRRTVSSTSSTTSATSATPPVTAPIPGVAPPPTTASEVILDEGSSGGGGLIARYGLMPWLIGGTAIAGLGIWFLLGSGTAASMRSARPVRANRRRRVSRNKPPAGYELVYSTGGHGGPYWSRDSAEKQAEKLMAGGRDQWIAVVPREEIVDLNEAHSVATLRRGLGWLRGKTRLPSARMVRNSTALGTARIRLSNSARRARRRGRSASEWMKSVAASPEAKLLGKPGAARVAARIWPGISGYDARGGWHEALRQNRITPAQRRRMSKKSFVFPSRRAWPINNARRAYAAIQFLRMGRVRSASDFNEIRNAVRTRYPRVWDIYGKNLSWDRSKAAKAKRASSRRRTSRRGAPRRIAANRRAR